MPVAQVVDALNEDLIDQKPEEILEHVAECVECKLDIMGVWEVIKVVGPTLDEQSRFSSSSNASK